MNPSTFGTGYLRVDLRVFCGFLVCIQTKMTTSTTNQTVWATRFVYEMILWQHEAIHATEKGDSENGS
jgi:hypothetical protein